eukprot:g39709.t1
MAEMDSLDAEVVEVAIGLYAVEYEVLLFQFAGDIIVALGEAQDRCGIKGVGGVKMVGDRKVLLFVTYRAQMLHETVPESALGLTDVEEATSGATDTVDQ